MARHSRAVGCIRRSGNRPESQEPVWPYRLEILRVIDSLKLTDHHSVATPVNWKDGQDCVVLPSISTEDARAKFPKGVTEIRPYLRTTPQPNR